MMKTLTAKIVARSSLLLALALLSGGASADIEVTTDELIPFVHASPAYYDFGSVKAPGMAMTHVFFNNNSSEDVPFFNVLCTGDFSAFRCSSSCSRLPPYGSCSVLVTFTPRSGDGMRRTITVQGTGSGAFAQSIVSGTDARR